MPSYGSNDGYGRQKLSDRPSICLTETGARQQDSSAMAALLAEKDLSREGGDPSGGAGASTSSAVDPDAPPDVQWVQAAKFGDVGFIRQLLNERPSLLSKQSRVGGQTALHHCATGGHLMCATELLDRGLAVNARDAHQSTPLMCAALSGELEMVSALIRRGAEVAAQDSRGQTALDIARAHGNAKVVELLRGVAGDQSPNGPTGER